MSYQMNANKTRDQGRMEDCALEGRSSLQKRQEGTKKRTGTVKWHVPACFEKETNKNKV